MPNEDWVRLPRPVAEGEQWTTANLPPQRLAEFLDAARLACFEPSVLNPDGLAGVPSWRYAYYETRLRDLLTRLGLR